MPKSSGDVASRQNSRNGSVHTPPLDKRDLWWNAFRKSAMEPHGIMTFDHAMLDRVPDVLLELVDEMCQDLDRHEDRALRFHDAVTQGFGFGSSSIFPPEVMPPLSEERLVNRCMEPNLDERTIPLPDTSHQVPVFDLPMPQPDLASGFSNKTFTQVELDVLPDWLVAVGASGNRETGHILPGKAVYCPFLLFERTHGQARHEIESSLNYCAMNGSAALRGIAMLYDQAYPRDSSHRPSNPVVFSCTVDDDIGMIYHHWMDEEDRYMVAPLCKFDFCITDHFMQYLAWIEAIEQWAIYFLLPDIKEALEVLKHADHTEAFLKSETLQEKQERVRQSLLRACENISRKEEMTSNPISKMANVTKGSSQQYTSSSTSAMLSSDTRPNDQSAELNEGSKRSWTPMLPTPAQLTSVAHSEPSPPLSPRSEWSGDSPTSDSPGRYSISSQLANQTHHEKSRTTSRSIQSEPSSRHQSQSGPLTPNTIAANISRVRTTPTPACITPVQSPDTRSRPARFDLPLTGELSPGPRTPSLIGSTVSSSSPRYAPSVLSSRSQPNLSHRGSNSSLQQHQRPKQTRTHSAKSLASEPNYLSSKQASGIRSRLTSGLGIIKERTRPKRVRTENAGPPTPRPGEVPMPTPAYDRNRFHVPAPPKPAAVLSPGNIWAEHMNHESNMAGVSHSQRATPAIPVFSPPPPPDTPRSFTSLYDPSYVPSYDHSSSGQELHAQLPPRSQSVVNTGSKSKHIPLKQYDPSYIPSYDYSSSNLDLQAQLPPRSQSVNLLGSKPRYVPPKQHRHKHAPSYDDSLINLELQAQLPPRSQSVNPLGSKTRHLPLRQYANGTDMITATTLVA